MSEGKDGVPKDRTPAGILLFLLACSVLLVLRWKTDTLLLLAVLFWGINFPVIKGPMEVMHPHVVNVLRFIFSALVLGTFHYRAQRHAAQRFFAPLRRHGKALVGLSLIGYVLYQVCFILGVANTQAGMAALIIASAPLWTAIITQVQGTERLSVWGWLSLGVTISGTLLVVFQDDTQLATEGTALFGNLMMLGAAFCWGAYTALSKKTLQHVGAISMTFLNLVIAAPALILLAIPYWDQAAFAALDTALWLAIIYSGAFSVGIAIVFWNISVKHTSAAYTSAFGNLVPVVALIAGVLFLNEVITWQQIVGGALIIAGLYGMRRLG
ncbi:MAG: EamA family transporter [Rhodothermales bacterium]